MKSKRRLLLMSCSATKLATPDGSPVPAYRVYDGPGFRVVRKYVSELLEVYALMGTKHKPHGAVAAPDLHIVILSAKHGPINWTTRIAHYDEKLTVDVALAVRDDWSLALRLFSADLKPDVAFVYGGAAYKLAAPVTRWQPPSCPVELSSGGQGYQLAQLKKWLEKGGEQ